MTSQPRKQTIAMHILPNIEKVKEIRQWKLIVYKKTDEWYIEWQRVTTIGTTSETNEKECYNEWKRVLQRVTAGDNEWQQVTTSGH